MRMTLKELIEKTNEKLIELDEKFPKSADSRVKNTLSERRVRSYINNQVLHKPFRGGGEIWYDESHLNRLLAIRSLQGTGMSENAIKTMSSIYQTEDSVAPGEYQAPAIFSSDGMSLSDVLGTVGSSLVSDSTQKMNSLNSDSENKAALNSFLSGVKASDPSLNLYASTASAAVAVPASTPPLVGAVAKSINNTDRLSNTFLNSVPLVSSRSMQEAGNKEKIDLSYAMSEASRNPVKSIQEYQLDEYGKIFLRVEDSAKISNPAVVLEKIKQILNIKEN